MCYFAAFVCVVAPAPVGGANCINLAKIYQLSGLALSSAASVPVSHFVSVLRLRHTTTDFFDQYHDQVYIDITLTSSIVYL